MNYMIKVGIVLSVVLISLVVFSSAQPATLEVSEEGVVDDGFLEDDQPFNFYSFLKRYFGSPGLNETETNDTADLFEDSGNMTLEAELSDDEVFLQILGREAFSFNVLALQCIIALDQSNAIVLVSNAESLSSLSSATYDEVAMLDVDSSNLGRKVEFLSSMSEFAVITSQLKEGLPNTVTGRREAYASLTRAIERLDNAVRNVNCDYNAIVEDELNPISADPVLDTESVSVTKPDDILECSMPFIYLDAKKSNEISIYPRYARIVNTLYYDSSTGTQYLTAPSGRSYFLVFIQVTHRGNLDGKIYTISTPAPSAFTLHGPDGNYKPVSTAKYTSVGEMYTQTTLGRRESSQSFLLFEVPNNLERESAYLSISLGSTYGTVSWNLS